MKIRSFILFFLFKLFFNFFFQFRRQSSSQQYMVKRGRENSPIYVNGNTNLMLQSPAFACSFNLDQNIYFYFFFIYKNSIFPLPSLFSSVSLVFPSVIVYLVNEIYIFVFNERKKIKNKNNNVESCKRR